MGVNELDNVRASETVIGWAIDLGLDTNDREVQLLAKKYQLEQDKLADNNIDKRSFYSRFKIGLIGLGLSVLASLSTFILWLVDYELRKLKAFFTGE